MPLRVTTHNGFAGTFIPYVNLAHAQLSFHGHKDAVKFLLGCNGVDLDAEQKQSSTDSAAVVQSPSATSVAADKSAANERPHQMMVVSGGDGYIDFRVGKWNLCVFFNFNKNLLLLLAGEDDDETSKQTAAANAAAAAMSQMPKDMSHLIVWQIDNPPIQSAQIVPRGKS
jgi:hypothetical protein